MAYAASPSDFQPRRGKARLRLGIPASVLTVHGRSRIMLLDLSETGARLEYEGETIGHGVLEWLGYEAFATVVRQSGGELGLRFDEPIAQDCVLDTRGWLPAIQQGEDELTRFAREWVDGHDGQRVSAHISGLRAEVLRQRAFASEMRAGHRARASGIGSWLHAARPFVFGGVLVGLFAGYCSNYL
jgi:hypothetical protein